METNGIVVLAFVLLFIMLVGGNYVFIAFAVSGLTALFFMGPVGESVARLIFVSLSGWELAAIPMFIFMAELISASGVGRKMYDGLSVFVQRLPGGLLHTNVAASALFAAVCGSTVATLATIGPLALPEQTRLGYNRRFIIGSIVGSANLGILIPPSINMIVYGVWVGVSVGKLFLGGIIPGIIMSLLFMTYILFSGLRHPEIAPNQDRTIVRITKIQAIKGIAPVAGLMLVIFIGLYGGWGTPTEIAGVGAMFALIYAGMSRGFGWSMLQRSLMNAARTSCMVLALLFAAKLLVTALGYSGIMETVVGLVAGLELGKMQLLFILYGFYIILGCFMDGLSLMLLTIPFVTPILVAAGIDLIWWGVILIVLVEMSFLTPPVGLLLYVGMKILDASLGELIRAVIPYFLLLIVGLLIFTFFPNIVMLIPNMMLGP